MTRWAAVLVIAWVVLAGSAWAIEPGEMLPDPALEARARTISQDLRCLVCQSESIDDSEAPLAHDLRRLVRERLVAGDSDRAVRDYLVARYGAYVLFRPPIEPGTYVLWFGPAALLAIAGFGSLIYLRRGAHRPDPLPLDATERARLDHLTGGGA